MNHVLCECGCGKRYPERLCVQIRRRSRYHPIEYVFIHHYKRVYGHAREKKHHVRR